MFASRSLTNAGALDRDKQLDVVSRLTTLASLRTRRGIPRYPTAPGCS